MQSRKLSSFTTNRSAFGCSIHCYLAKRKILLRVLCENRLLIVSHVASDVPSQAFTIQHPRSMEQPSSTHDSLFYYQILTDLRRTWPGRRAAFLS
ncbi:hypothetical protein VTO42DRAFT_8411 [Malbranchea cinnamomea]